MFWMQIKSYTRSSSFRFALLIVLIIWLSIGLVLSLMYWQLRESIWSDLDARLQGQVEYIAKLAEVNPGFSTSSLIAIVNSSGEFNVSDRTNKHSGYSTKHAVERSAHSIRSGHNTTPKRQAIGIANPPEHMTQCVHEDKEVMDSTENIAYISRLLTLPSGDQLLVSRNIEYLQDLDRSIFNTLMLGLTITFILALAGSVIITRRSLRQINRINAACQTIMDGDLDHRIPVSGMGSAQSPDDHEQMAMNINAMLDKIQELMGQIRQVSDNIAHDLKSPLARLRTRLELLEQQSSSEEMQDAIAEADRLLIMFKGLLGLSRLEAGTLQQKKTVDMQNLMMDVCELYEPLMEDRQIALISEIAPGKVHGDPDLLFQAFTNLLDNANKFTPSQGKVSIQCGQDSESYQVLIKDSGPSIPEEKLQKVFERFCRLDNARTTSGFGLGLSLVQVIVKLHGGAIELSNQQGLCVSVTLPKMQIK